MLYKHGEAFHIYSVIFSLTQFLIQIISNFSPAHSQIHSPGSRLCSLSHPCLIYLGHLVHHPVLPDLPCLKYPLTVSSSCHGDANEKDRLQCDDCISSRQDIIIAVRERKKTQIARRTSRCGKGAGEILGVTRRGVLV